MIGLIFGETSFPKEILKKIKKKKKKYLIIDLTKIEFLKERKIVLQYLLVNFEKLSIF